MKNLISPEFTLDDLVFEHRNHDYGAFTIRKNYDRNMSKAGLLAILFFIVAFLFPGILKLYNPNATWTSCSEELKINEVIINPAIEKVVVINRTEGSTPSKALNIQKPDATPKVINDDVEKQNVLPNNKPDILNFENTANANAGVEINTPSENSSGSAYSISNNNTGVLTSSDEVLMFVDELPIFGKDNSSLSKFLKDKVKYPQFARENHIEGKVIIEFIIDKNGEVKAAKILRGIGGGCDEEAFHAIENMPKWKAGIQHGKPVNVKLVLPIDFKLN